ncbi:DUF934 domain-containing protein [Derxia gummosa]|uniref:DUF934 domain-containing protein n=1 Tax=Derxia gummosa DSM 723 TaxID=1121388 RepID=A0A8B6X1L7_9BURK|nr:DUF934 domain-containing protein [Derxia gummosa]
MSDVITTLGGTPALAADDWTRIEDASAGIPATGKVIVPLAWALEHADELKARGDFGVWLKPDDVAEAAAPLLGSAGIVAVQYLKFTDGRGHSIAWLLRKRLGYTGDIRAFGDVRRDQLFNLRRTGFTSFAMAEGQNVAAALAGFTAFSGAYQLSADGRAPAWLAAASA